MNMGLAHIILRSTLFSDPSLMCKRTPLLGTGTWEMIKHLQCQQFGKIAKLKIFVFLLELVLAFKQLEQIWAFL